MFPVSFLLGNLAGSSFAQNWPPFLDFCFQKHNAPERVPVFQLRPSGLWKEYTSTKRVSAGQANVWSHLSMQRGSTMDTKTECLHSPAMPPLFWPGPCIFRSPPPRLPLSCCLNNASLPQSCHGNPQRPSPHCHLTIHGCRPQGPVATATSTPHLPCALWGRGGRPPSPG